MPDATPRCSAGTLLMIDDELGAANMPLPIPFAAMSRAKAQYGKFDRQQHQADEAAAEHDHAGGGHAPGAEAVGEDPGHRPRDEEAGGEGQQEDAGPQRRLAVVVAVQGQPDPLQPDDEHELHPASGDGHGEGRRCCRR